MASEDVHGDDYEVNDPTQTSALTQVSVTVAGVAVVAANQNRISLILFNSGATPVNIALGNAISSTLYTLTIPAGGSFSLPFAWQGKVMAMVASGSGTLQVSEFTP